jgi:hypothetical protein
MQPNALLIQQNFIVVKSGCYRFVVFTINQVLCHPRREVFMGRSRKPMQGLVWRPMLLMTFWLLALGWYFRNK